MASKFIILAIIVTLAVAHGRDITVVHNSNEMVKSDKEGRTLEIPVIGSILMIAFKIAGLVISSALSLLEYKLTALSFVSSIASWVFQNYLPVIVGTVVVVGLCVITSSFSSEPVYEIDHELLRAARGLDQGIVKYGRLI